MANDGFQNDFDLGDQGFPSMRDDMNNAFQSLASKSRGPVAPSTTYANQWWYDETNGILKIRNPDNNGWLTFMTFDGVTGEYTLPPSRLEGVTATATQINTASTHYVPTGGIIMWSGSVLAIPTGWALCDGTDGTPNLRNRFVVGVGVNSTYDIGDTGGGTATLSVANMPSHNHSATSTSTSTVTDPGHSHDYAGVVPSSGQGVSSRNSVPSTKSTTTETTGITVDTSTSTTIGYAGSGTAFNIIPKYYALAYIMKT